MDGFEAPIIGVGGIVPAIYREETIMCVKRSFALLLTAAILSSWAVLEVHAQFQFSTPVRLSDDVNRPSDNWEQSITSDDSSLFFASKRSGAVGDWTFWVATRGSATEPWSNVQNLTISQSFCTGPQVLRAGRNHPSPGCEISADSLHHWK